MARIPGLPPHLVEVPPAPHSPDDPDRDAKRRAWADWKYAVLRYRIERHQVCEADPVQREIELRKCAASPAYFITVWGTIYEPRTRGGRGGDIAFIPFAKQVEMVDWLISLLHADGASADGVVSKSRDVGASWTVCAISVWGLLWASPWQGRLYSRKEDLVDAPSPDSLFWKIDFILRHLPDWMKPRLTRQKLVLRNDENGNFIGGESTNTKAGRGSRATWVAFDEAAFIPNFLSIWTSTGASTDHRIAISSESVDEGPDFYHLRTGEGPGGAEMLVKPSLFEFDWWDHPTHDDAWYEEEKKRYAADPAGFQREYLRNPLAGSTSLVYPEAQAIGIDAQVQYQPSLPQYTSIDPGVRDDSGIVFLQEDVTTGFVDVLDGYMNRGLPADYYGSLLRGVPESGEWEYDDNAMRLMEWLRVRPRAIVYGDTYGHNREAATLDSFYSRLEKYGIYVVKDRLQTGQIAQYREQARTFRGRREALREILPRLRFADTPGARLVLAALKANRYKANQDETVAEARAPQHDWTSHLVSALEFFAVNRVMERQVLATPLRAPRNPRRLPSARSHVGLGRRRELERLGVPEGVSSRHQHATWSE